MTTPAVNIYLRPAAFYTRYSQQIIPYDPRVHPAPTQSGGGLTWRVRPASKTSLIRPDGSRAPLAWDHRWCSVTLPIVSRSIDTVRRLGGQTIRTWGSVPVVRDVEEMITLAGMHWCFGTGSFPLGTDAEAKTRALLKLADGKANLGNTLGELRQSANTVRSVAEMALDGFSAAANAAVGMKRGVVNEILGKGVRPRRKGESLSSAKRRMREEQKVLDKWMEYQMGIVPMVMDIDQLGQALSDSLFVEKKKFRASIRAGSETRMVGESFTSSTLTSAIADSALVTGAARCHISMIYDIPVSGARTFNQLGLGNPASVAWELTAYSWLVDYVVRVGPWLESLSAASGTAFVEGSISRVMEVMDVRFGLKTNSSVLFEYVILEEGVVNTTFLLGRMNRELLGPKGLFPSIVPPIRQNLGLTQMANAITALANLAK